MELLCQGSSGEWLEGGAHTWRWSGLGPVGSPAASRLPEPRIQVLPRLNLHDLAILALPGALAPLSVNGDDMSTCLVGLLSRLR